MKAVLRQSKAVPAMALFVLMLIGGRCFTPSGAPRRARSAVTMRATKSDAIGLAAAKLSKAAYPFMTQVDWNDHTFWTVPGSDAISWTKALAKVIDHGASMDSEMVKEGCLVHSNAIKNLGANGVCSEAELTAINAAIGRMIASAPESKTMAVHDAVKALIPAEVPPYLMSKVNENNAKKAYAALIEFTEVVKANPITPSTPQSTLSSSSASSIKEAASKMGKAVYPFMKQVDWTDDLWGKTVPGQAQKTLKAVDKMILMGTQMDSAALKEAALAHVKAIENMDDKGVMTPEDLDAINTGIGKTIASVPHASVMDVYQSMGNLVSNPGIPQYVLGKQDPKAALEAYQSLMEFKDTVRAAQKNERPEEQGFLSADQNIMLISAIIALNVVGTLLVR